MTGLVLILLAAACIASLFLTGVLVRVGAAAGTLDSPGVAGHEKSLRRVPNIGGIAIAAVFVLPLVAGLVLVHVAPGAVSDAVPAITPWLDRIYATTPTAMALLACVVVLHCLGLLDDRRGLGVLPKFAVQISCAAVLTIWFDVRMLTVIDTWLGIGPLPSIVMTVVWIVVITNAMNYLDNMDGVTAGIAVVSGGLLMLAALLNAQWFVAGSLALLVGGCLGFLWWNRPPARIFMGDGGSLVIGFVLSVLVIRMVWYDPEAGTGLGTAWYSVFMPLIVLALPIYDFVTVSTIRMLQSRNPFRGDQQHFSHRLVERGLGPFGALAVLWLLCGVTGIAGLLLATADATGAVLIAALVAMVLTVVAVLDFGGRGSIRG